MSRREIIVGNAETLRQISEQSHRQVKTRSMKARDQREVLWLSEERRQFTRMKDLFEIERFFLIDFFPFGRIEILSTMRQIAEVLVIDLILHFHVRWKLEVFFGQSEHLSLSIDETLIAKIEETCCRTNIEDRRDNSRFIVLEVDDGQGSERHVVTD